MIWWLTPYPKEFEKDLFKEVTAPHPTTLALVASALRLKEIEDVKKAKGMIWTMIDINIVYWSDSIRFIQPMELYSRWIPH